MDQAQFLTLRELGININLNETMLNFNLHDLPSNPTRTSIAKWNEMLCNPTHQWVWDFQRNSKHEPAVLIFIHVINLIVLKIKSDVPSNVLPTNRTGRQFIEQSHGLFTKMKLEMSNCSNPIELLIESTKKNGII